MNIKPSKEETSTTIGSVETKSEVQKSQSGFGRRQRVKKPLSKRKEYKFSQIKDKRQRLYFRILKKSGAFEDLIYSSKNKVAVAEDFTQFIDILKLIVAVHDECKKFMEKEQISNSDE